MRESLVISQKVRTFAPVLKMVVIHSVRANGNRSLGKNAKVSLFYGQPDAHRCMPSAPVITAAIQKDFGALRGTAIFRTTGCAAVPLSNRLLGVDRVMKQEQEIWKDIEGYDGKYQVSNLGRVRSFRIKSDGVILVQRPNAGGYPYVELGKKKRPVHQLVAYAFCDGYKEGLHVNHKNEIKTDNRADNLEWVTQKQNNNYGTHNERVGKTSRATQGYVVNQYTINGEFVRSYQSEHEAAKAIGGNIGSISSCANGKRSSAYGYRWEFKYGPRRNPNNVKQPRKVEHKQYDTTSLDGEQWRDIKGYDGVYQVSNLGRVKSVDHRFPDGSFHAGRLLKLTTHKKTGLVEVGMYSVRTGRKTVSVARLVATAFVDGYQPGFIVHHKNDDYADNRADNLEWVLKNTYGRAVLQLTTNGKLVAEYLSISQACKALGVHHRQISRSIDVEGATAHGFIWKHKEKK